MSPHRKRPACRRPFVIAMVATLAGVAVIAAGPEDDTWDDPPPAAFTAHCLAMTVRPDVWDTATTQIDALHAASFTGYPRCLFLIAKSFDKDDIDVLAGSQATDTNGQGENWVGIAVAAHGWYWVAKAGKLHFDSRSEARASGTYEILAESIPWHWTLPNEELGRSVKVPSARRWL